MRELAAATVLGLLLTGCATVNYTYKGKPCDIVLETNDSLVLKCDKVTRKQPIEREINGRRVILYPPIRE